MKRTKSLTFQLLPACGNKGYEMALSIQQHQRIQTYPHARCSLDMECAHKSLEWWELDALARLLAWLERLNYWSRSFELFPRYFLPNTLCPFHYDGACLVHNTLLVMTDWAFWNSEQNISIYSLSHWWAMAEDDSNPWKSSQWNRCDSKSNNINL